MIREIFLFLTFFISYDSFCQKSNNVWCFGDSALIDFNNPNAPTTGESAIRSRGSCTSIADSSGNLLFYANTRYGMFGKTTLVWTKKNVIMQNGSNVVGEGWYVELVIIPYPNHNNLYILFSISITGSSQYGLYYSIIDMNLNGGEGAVVQKNIQLLTYQSKDGIKAIKHGNGNDWWIIYHQWASNPSNELHVFLVDSAGVHSPIVQYVGSLASGSLGDFVFTQRGDRFYMCNNANYIERFDFDRCTGIISNPFIISPIGVANPYWGIALSKNDSVLYCSTNHGSQGGYLYQFNLYAPNILTSRVTLFNFNWASYPGSCGMLRLAPDNKIYLSNPHWGNTLYYDSTDYDTLNMHLSVINSPNNLGLSCNLQPYSFYLGGKRTYWGLPNNPNYDLGPLEDPSCPIITSVNANQQIIQNVLSVYDNSSLQLAFINAKGLKGRDCSIHIFDITGKVIYSKDVTLTSEYFTTDLNTISLANGIYIVNLVTNKEQLIRKFVKD